MMTLVAFVRRHSDLSREEFLTHWHDVHGPLIRDTPGLAERIISYEQLPTGPHDRSGFDGVAIQRYRSWQDFVDLLADPAGEVMRADEARFLDTSATVVTFTEGARSVIGDDGDGGNVIGGTGGEDAGGSGGDAIAAPDDAADDADAAGETTGGEAP